MLGGGHLSCLDVYSGNVTKTSRNLENIISFYVFVCVPEYPSVHHMHAVPWRLEGPSDPLELELLKVLSCSVGTGNRT